MQEPLRVGSAIHILCPHIYNKRLRRGGCVGHVRASPKGGVWSCASNQHHLTYTSMNKTLPAG